MGNQSIEKIGIVIQGPTVYADVSQILACYKRHKYIIWSTWADEPETNLSQIKKSGIPFLLNEKTDFTGNGNVYLQCVTTYNGVNKLSELYPDINHFVKIRSDFIIDNLNRFIENVKIVLANNAIAFTGYGHVIDTGRVILSDCLNMGNKQEILKFWFPERGEEVGFPYAEDWLQKRYFGSSKLFKNLKFVNAQRFYLNTYGYQIYSLKWKMRWNNQFSYMIIDNYVQQYPHDGSVTPPSVFKRGLRKMRNILFNRK